MKRHFYYRAFGMDISSEIKINMLPPAECAAADVSIVCGDLAWRQSKMEPRRYTSVQPGEIFFWVPDVGRFRITNGSEIEVDPAPGVQEGLVAVYIMGSCLGAVLHQRGVFLLHGSCVVRDGEAILITGDSGAGKSTLAAEFLRRGWKLLTDDVAAVTGIEDGVPVVQSSYPSQKLWQDTIDRYGRTEELLPLYQEQRRDKFGIRVKDYYEGQASLRTVVRLAVMEDICGVGRVEGFAKVDQLRKNTYRENMILPEDRSRHFQRCVTMSDQINMLVAVRAKGRDCAAELYEKITDVL